MHHESDLNLYLECFQHPSSKNSLRETLHALANLLSSEDELKNMFREKKGLNLLVKLLISQKDMAILQSTMFTLSCAIESCVSSQNVLLQKGTLELLMGFMKKGCTNKLFPSSMLLLSYLTQGNSFGQNKCRQSGIITLLQDLLRTCHKITKENKHVWICVLTCLSSLVNNPRNTLNQDACLEIIPLCMSVLRENLSHLDIVKSVTSFIRLCLSDNDKIQEKFSLIGGVTVCIEILSHVQCEQTAAALISLLNATPKGFQSNEEMELVPVLLRWINNADKDNIPAALHTLSIVIGNNAQARSLMLSNDNAMASIIKCMSAVDEGTRKTAKLLLQLMFHNKTESEAEVESDLESASYEIVKQRTRKHARSKCATSDHVVHTKPRCSTPANKRTKVVVKSAASWSIPRPSKRHKTASPLTPDSWTPHPSPLTPQPTPAVRDTCRTDLLKNVVPVLQDSSKGVDMASSRFLDFPSDHSREETMLNVVQPSLSRQNSTTTSDMTQSVVDMVGAMVDTKMNGFLEKIGKVLSTSIPSASNEPVKQPLQEREMLCVSDEESKSAEPMKCNVEIQTCDLEETMKNIKLVENVEDISDSASITTHVSQTSLLRSFFDVNPDLLPHETTECDGVQSLIQSSPSEVTKSVEKTSGGADSGFENISTASSLTIDDVWPIANLSQTFNKIASAPEGSSVPRLRHNSRQKRAPFSEQEIANLCTGVKVFGKSWNAILLRFEFHPNRTARDIRRRYEQIKKFACGSGLRHERPDAWSTAELRRLRRGVGRFGTNWKDILQHYDFRKKRSENELCRKWLTIACQ